jgi:hypothetical protein
MPIPGRKDLHRPPRGSWRFFVRKEAPSAGMRVVETPPETNIARQEEFWNEYCVFDIRLSLFLILKGRYALERDNNCPTRPAG